VCKAKSHPGIAYNECADAAARYQEHKLIQAMQAQECHVLALVVILSIIWLAFEAVTPQMPQL